MNRPPVEALLAGDNWPLRRRWMTIALIWMAGNVQYLILFGADTAINQNVVITMVGAIVSIIFAYVFGAVWDDQNKRSTIQDFTVYDEEVDAEEEALQRKMKRR